VQIPELRKKSRMDYLKKRREDKLVELEDDIRDNKYVFDDVQ
jgi:pre-mRNA-splicing factor ATP-dependent RNA helicase DHX16